MVGRAAKSGVVRMGPEERVVALGAEVDRLRAVQRGLVRSGCERHEGVTVRWRGSGDGVACPVCVAEETVAMVLSERPEPGELVQARGVAWGWCRRAVACAEAAVRAEARREEDVGLHQRMLERLSQDVGRLRHERDEARRLVSQETRA